MKARNSISNFLTSVAKDGLARPYRFEVEIPRPLCVGNEFSEESRVSLYCKSAQLPQSRIITTRNQYFGPPEYRPIGVDYGGDNLTLTFYVDAKMRVKAFFDTWIDGVVNRKTGITEYRDNYVVNMKVRQLSPNASVNDPGIISGSAKQGTAILKANNNSAANLESVVYQINFEQAFPVAVNPLNLDHGSTGQFHELSVTFNYRRWTWAVPDSQTGKLADNTFWNDPSIPERKIAGAQIPDERPFINSVIT